MTENSENYEIARPIPQAVLQASAVLKRWGWIGFWCQVVIGIVSLLALIPGSVGTQQKSSGSGLGAFFAICGIVALAISVYFSFRYTKIADELRVPDAAQRPKRTDTIKVIRLGLLVNLLGMSFALLGTQSVVGSVLIKSVKQIPGANVGGFGCLVVPADIFSIQANTTEVTAHFLGLAISFWLLNRLAK